MISNWKRQIFGIAAISAIVSVGSPVAAQGVWISIFGSRELDGSAVFGMGWDYNIPDADVEALEECVDNGGSYCNRLAAFLTACAAVAKGRHDHSFGIGYGLTRDIAEYYSLVQCQYTGAICRVDISRCP